MDEPLSNLDAKLRVQMRAEIQKLHLKINTTTIYVTHDQTEAMTMATRIVVMKDGIIQQIGKPEEVYKNPKNVFVGGFIGSPAMNFFHAKVQKSDFIIGNQHFKIPDNYQNLLKNQQEVIVGIRPEHILIGKSLNSFTAKVDVNELLGAESYIHSSLNGETFIAKVAGANSKNKEQEEDFSFIMEELQFFDVESEERIEKELIVI